MDKYKSTIIIRSEYPEEDEHIEVKGSSDWVPTSYNLCMFFYYTLQKMGFTGADINEGMKRVVENKNKRHEQ